MGGFSPSRQVRSRSDAAQTTPITVFLAATYLWAWGFWGYWVAAMPPGGLVVSPLFVLSAIVGGLAPTLAAIVTVRVFAGRAALRTLLTGLTRWRLPATHITLALLIVPVSTLAAVGLQRLALGPLTPPDPAVIAMAAVWPVMAALGEEIGWRGFLFPRLDARIGPVGAALLIGLVWGLWHLPADYIGLKAYGGLFWLAFLVNGPVVLTAHALIMAWLWVRSGGSLVLMVLYHATITACSMLAPTAGGQTATGLIAAAIGVGVLWIVALGLWALARPSRA